jgi:hypothetical protein
MPQIVEVEVRQLRALDGVLPGERKWSQRPVPKTRPLLFEPRRRLERGLLV